MFFFIQLKFIQVCGCGLEVLSLRIFLWGGGEGIGAVGRILQNRGIYWGTFNKVRGYVIQSFVGRTVIRKI